MYTRDPLTREEGFINVPGVPEAPKDGRIYARSNGQWVDITDCLSCPTNTIGQVIITQIDQQPPSVGTVHNYRATTPAMDTSITDLTYAWTANSDQVTYTNPSSQSTNVVFEQPGVYTLTCEVSSDVALDSPQIGRKSVNVEIEETCRVITDPDGIYIVTEHLGDHPSPSPSPSTIT